MDLSEAGMAMNRPDLAALIVGMLLPYSFDFNRNLPYNHFVCG